MMRDPRRRSPESSRRRRRDRRDSREQLAAAAAASTTTLSTIPGPSQQYQQLQQQQQQQPLPHIYSQPQYPHYYADPQRYPEPERYSARLERYDDPQRYTHPQPQSYPHPEQYPPTEAFVNPLGYTEQQPYVEPQTYQQPREPETMRPRGGSSSSSSSSTSSSLLNISAKSPKFGGVFSTFFRAPSEQRKERRRKKQKARILSFGNSSSSSVNSDMAYGRGYIDRDKSQRASPMPQGHPSPALYRADAVDASHRPPPVPRDKTDEEILNIGRQLQDIARKQNQADLKAASKSRTSQVAGVAGAAAAAAAFSHFRPKTKTDSKTRGSATSKPNQTASSSDDDWESASEDESTTDESDNGLAYGSVFKPPKSARISSESPEQIKPPERRSTIVDPRLFGPVNSLHGAVKSPCGFGEEDPRSAGSSRRHHEETIAQVEPPKNGKQPMQRIYPVPTSDPDRFDYDRGSVVSSRQDLPQRARPEPVPIQQPIPIVPVSSKVYDAERFEEDERTKQRRSPPKGRSAAENAIAGVGVAAAAVGAAMAYSRRDSGDHSERRDDPPSEAPKRREGPRDPQQSRRKDEPEQLIRVELEDRETRKQDDPRRSHRRKDADVVDARDKKRVGRSDPAYEALKRRATERDPRPEVYRLPQGDEIRVEYDPNDDRRPREEPKEPRREERKTVVVDDRRETMRSERPTELPRDKYGVEQPEAPSTQAPIDPFQFQVADDAFQTPKYATPKRPLTPQVVTVDREPSFDNSPPRKPDYSESRMSRKDSFELEQRLEQYQQAAQDRSRPPASRRRGDSIEEEERVAKSIYDEAKNATVPIAAAAVAAAIAAEAERSRRHRRDQVTKDGPGDESQAVKDAVQEEADRYYRETVIARKIAKEEIRSRSASPHDESVVGKWQEHDNGPEVVTIVTPPEMEHHHHHHHDKSPYDAPNADVRIDHIIIPEELSRFGLPGRQLAAGEVPKFQSRDPSCERERPLLNLVLPTPVVTPRHTPAPEQQKEPSSSNQKEEAPQPRQVRPVGAPSSDAVPATEIVLGPRGEAVERPTTPIVKSVTWGENETKSFDIESPEPPKKSASSTSSKSKKKKKLGKSSPWGIISAAVGTGAAAAAAAAAPDMRDPFESKPDEHRERHSPPESPKSRGIEPVAEPTVPPASHERSKPFEDEPDLPPAPGPKPSSPQTSRMPGAFADDIEFASVLAAGLQDTGFDPNIVIDNPTYMRRDSPPGQSEPMVYQQPFAETVTDLGVYRPEGPAPADSGFVIGEVPETPVAERELGDDHLTESPRARERRDKGKVKETRLVEQEPPVEDVESPRKLSKKEKRKQKAAKRQSMDDAPADETYDTPLALSRPAPTPSSETPLDHEKPRSYYDVPEATSRDAPTFLNHPGPVYERPHTYYGYGGPQPTPLSQSNPYSNAVSAHDRPHSYYGAPEMTLRNEPVPMDESVSRYEKPRAFYDTPQSPETVIAPGSKDRGFQDVPTWDLPAISDVPRSYGETLASAASASEAAPVDYEPAATSKSSKKEKKKRSKSSKSEVIVVQEDEDEPPTERSLRDETGASPEKLLESERSHYSGPQETAEDAWDTPARKKKSKKSKQSSDEWTDVEKQSDYTPTIERSSTRDDDLGEWDDLPTKSQRDRSRFEDRDVSSVVSDPSSRREKSDRRSKSSRHEDRDASSVVVSDPTTRRDKSDRRSKNIGDEDRDASSVVSDPLSRRDKSERRSHSSRHDDRDVASVVSEPTSRSEKSERRSKSLRDEERDAGSVASDRSSRRDKSDRRSNGTRHEDDDDAKSVASGSSGRKRRSDDQKSPKEEEKRSSGFFNSLFRGGNNKEVSGKDEKSSFLDNAGTLGAGAGLAGAVAALGSLMSRSNATEPPQMEEPVDIPRSRERSSSPTRDVDIDPDIVPRDIRPAIDPQYGDLLPLPPSPMSPSTLGSPTEELEELPALPDSRPETPPEEWRRQHETKTPKTHSRKRSNIETPLRSPSQTAVPFKLRLGQRSTPSSSPGKFGPSPTSSPPVTTAPDATHDTTPTSGTNARRPSRPISWESSREIKPLYLLEQSRQESAAQSMEPPVDFPELPPSEPPSRESPAPEFSLREDDAKYFNQLQASPFEPNDLRIDTDMSQYPDQADRQFGSQETTPKAEHAIQHVGALFERPSPALPELPDAAKHLDLPENYYAELPPLPASPLDTPVMGPKAEPADTISQERSLYGPASPALPTATDAARQSAFSHANLSDLPALPASPVSGAAETLKQPVIPTSELEELPALHDSPSARPTTMPEPEPVETTSKERNTPPSPMPSRSYDATVSIAEIEEQDFSGSHNTALAALAGGAAAGLAAASLIDHAKAEEKAAEVERETEALGPSASAEPPADGKKSKKDKKKKKKAKGMSIDNTTLPSADIASSVSTDKENLLSTDATPATPAEELTTPISNEVTRSMPTEEQATPSSLNENVSSISVGHDEPPSVDAVPSASTSTEDAILASTDCTTAPSIEAMHTANDALPPLPPVSAEETLYLSNDADLSVADGENALPSIRDNQPLEPTDKTPREPAHSAVVPADISFPAEGDVAAVGDTAADSEVTEPAAAELLAEDTAGEKKLSKKEKKKKLQKIKKAWEQAQAEMPELERSAEPNKQTSEAALDTDAPISSSSEPAKATETNEVEEAASIPLPGALDTAEEAALLEPETTKETMQAQEAAGTQLADISEPALATPLLQSEKVPVTTEAEQAASVPLPEDLEPMTDSYLSSETEKAKDAQDPEQPESVPDFKEPITAQEEAQTTLPDFGSSKDAVEAGLPAAPPTLDSLASDVKKGKKKKGKKSVDDEPLLPNLAPEVPPDSSLSAGPTLDSDGKPLDAIANVQSEQQAPVVESLNAEDDSFKQELSLQPLEEKTAEQIDVISEPRALPLEAAEKSFGPSDDLGEQQTTVQDQSDKSAEKVVIPELQPAPLTREPSSKLDADPSEQQTSATQSDETLAITDSQQEQPVPIPESSPPAEEPTIQSREVEEPTETPSAPLSKKQKKKLKKSRKSLTADDELLAAIATKTTDPQPEPAVDRVPSTSNLDVEPIEAGISEAAPPESVADGTIAAAPVDQIVDDVSVATQAAATPLPEDATEMLEEVPEERPEPALIEVASAIPLPEDIPTEPEETPAQATETVASAMPLSEDAAEKATTTALETSDNVPIVDTDEKPTAEPVPANVEAPPTEAVQPESSGKKKKKKKKGKGGSLSQLDDVMSAETTPLQSPGVQTPTTEAPVDGPFDAKAPMADSRAVDSPIAEPSAKEVPTSEIPSVETPVVETPAAETPAETPADETPIVETPAIENLPAEISSDEPLPTRAEALEAASSIETPAAESAPSESAIAETLTENPTVDESLKTQPTDIVPTETQQVEDAILQTNEASLASDKAATATDMPETSISSLVPDEQIETPGLAEDTSKSSKKSKKKKKKDKKAAEAEPEVPAVAADDVPTQALDSTLHNSPADEKPIETDSTGMQEPVATVDQPQSGNVNVTDLAAENMLNAGPQTPTMSESQDEAFVTPPQGPATPRGQVEAFENLSQEPTLVDSQIGSFDVKSQGPRDDKDQHRGLDSPIEPETPTSSKKSKKKAKKEAAAAAAAAAAVTALEPKTEDVAKDSDNKDAKDETITDNGISNTIPDKLGEMEQSSQEPPTSGEFATDSMISEEADPGPTVTKKGKKKKKGKKSSTLDLEPENSPSTSTLETTADVANTREQSAYLTSPSGEPGSDETRFLQADAPIEAELPASPTASKKRKSVTWAPGLESFSTSPEPAPHQEGEDERLGDVSTTESAPACETAFETEPQLRQNESVAGGSPEAIGHGDVVASQGIEMDQTTTAEAEKDLEPEGQAQIRYASEPSEALSGLQDTSPNPGGDGFPSSPGLKATRGVAGEPIATQQTDSPWGGQMPPTPASSSMSDIEVANRESGETLLSEVDAEQDTSAKANATNLEPAGRPDAIDEPSAEVSAQTGEVDIPDPGLHVGVGPVSGPVDDKSVGDTQSGRIADAQPVGPALTDSALEAGDPHDTPVMALANQDDTNMEILPQPLHHVPGPSPVVVDKISDAGITDSSAAGILPLGDEQHDNNISNVRNKEAAGDAEKDETKDLHDHLATDAALAGLSENPESLGEPITSEPQLKPLSETLPGPEPTGDVNTTQDSDQTETRAGREDGFRSEPSSSSKMSKKDKKSKKTKAASSEPVPQDDVQDVKEQTVDDGAPAVQAVDGPVQAPEQAGPEPSSGVKDALEMAPVMEAVEAGEDEWASQPSGKKSKKDRKKRAAAETAAAAAATGQSNEPAFERSEVIDEENSPSQPALDEASKIDVAGDEQTTPVDTIETPIDAPEVQESKESTETVGPVESATAEVHALARPTTDIPGNSVTTDEKPGAPEEADLSGFEPTKKSKKDKKKKRQSISLDDSHELVSPKAQPEESESPKGTTTVAPAPLEDTFLPNTENKPAEDVPSSTEAGAEDLQKTEKSDETPATQAQDPTIQPIEAPAAGNSEVTPESPSVQLKNIDSAPQTDLDTLGDGTAPLQDEELPVVTKKSKKDKKKKKGLAPTSTPDEAPATPEPELVDQSAFPAANQTPEPPVVPPETPTAEDQSHKAVEEATTAEATPTTEPPLVPSEVPVIEEQISTPVGEEAPTSKKSKKDMKKKKVASIDTPEEQLSVVEGETVPESTTMSQTAETLKEPALTTIDEATLPKGASAEETAPTPETTQPTEQKPTEAEPTEDKPASETPVMEVEQPKTEVDPFAGLSKKEKKKKKAELAAVEKAAAEAAAESAAAVGKAPIPDPAEPVEVNAAEAPAEEKSLEEQPARETLAEGNPVLEPESAEAVEKAAETTPEPPQAEVDPFAGLSKKAKKKKLAEIAAAEVEAAAALNPPVETDKALEETVVEEKPAIDKSAVEETSAEKAVTEVTAEAEQKSTDKSFEETPVEDKHVDEKPAKREMPQDDSSKDEIQTESTPIAEQQPVSPKVEKDPFAGLSKKEKKKERAELAAAEEAAADAIAKTAEEKSVDGHPVEAAVGDETIEDTPTELKPAEESLLDDKLANKEHAEEVSATEAPQTKEDPSAGLNEKEEKPAAEMATADAVSEPAVVGTTQIAEDKPAETALDDKSVEEKPSDVIVEDKPVEDKPVEENADEKPEPEPPILEVDPFAGLSKKQKKKKMAEMAKAAAAAEAKEAIEEKPADSQTDNASKQVPALESDPSASVENTSKEDSVPAPLEETPQSADIANPEDELPVPEKKSKKDKKKKGKASQSDLVVEPVLEQLVEQQPEQQLASELQAEVPPSAQTEVQSTSLETAHPETVFSDKVAGPESTPAPEQLSAVEEAIPDQETEAVQPTDPEQEFPLTTGKKTKKSKGEKGLTELESESQSPNITVPQDDQSLAVEAPATEVSSVDQLAVAQPEDVPAESQMRSAGVESLPDAPAAPDVNAGDESPLTGKKAKKAKKKGKSLDLTEPEASTEPAPEVTMSAAEPAPELATESITGPVAAPPTEVFLGPSESAEDTVQELSPAMPHTPLEQSADQSAQSETVAQTNEDFSAPKLSKKDKKKKKKGKLQDDSNPPSGAATPTVLESSDPLDVPAAAQTIPDTSPASIPLPEPAELSREPPLETSANQDNTSSEVAEETPLATDLLSSKTTPQEGAPESKSLNTTQLSSEEADLPPVDSNTPDKDSVVVEPAEASRDIESSAVPPGSEPTTSQDHPQAESRSVEEPLAATESPASLSDPVQEVGKGAVIEHQPPAKEEWPEATPAKKSKKDKKKNRKSKAGDDFDLGSETAMPLEIAAEAAKDVTTTDQASTTDNNVTSDLPIVEPPITATAPEVPAQDLADEVGEEPKHLVHETTQEQRADDKKLDAPTKSETLTLEPDVDGPVSVEEPQELVVKGCKDKEERKSVQPETTAPAIDESSTPPEDHATHPVKETSTADPATEISTVESTEDTTAPAEESPELPTSKKSKSKKKKSPLVEPEVIAEAPASSASLEAEPQTVLSQEDQTAKTNLPEAPLDNNANAGTLANEPELPSKHGPGFDSKSTPDHQPQVETADDAVNKSSGTLSLDAQSIIENREVDEAPKAAKQEPAIKDLPADAPATPAEEWPEAVTTIKSKKDKKKKRQGLPLDDPEADSPLASGIATPQAVPAENETASKPESGTSLEAPADEVTVQSTDGPSEQPAAEINVVAAEKSAEPMESSEPIPTSVIPAGFNKLDDETNSQRELDEPTVPVLKTTESAEPVPLVEQTVPETTSEETSQDTRPTVENSTADTETSANIAETAGEAATDNTRSSEENNQQTPAIPASETAHEPAAAGDDEWNVPGTKRSKKGKKSKKQSISLDLRSPVSAALNSQQDSVVPGPEMSKSEEAEGKIEYFDKAPRDITRSPTTPSPPEPAAAEFVTEGVDTAHPPTSNKSVGVDLTPAQETSRVVHELPFDQSDKRKKIKTRELSNTLLPEPIMSSREIAAAYVDGGHGAPAEEASRATGQLSLPTVEPDTPQDQGPAERKMDEDASQQELNTSSARGMAASYLEHRNDQTMDEPIQPETIEKHPDSESSGMGIAAGIAAAAAGAAVLASKSSSAKKKKGKTSKYVDKRASQEEDMLDDPSLWEGADRKQVGEAANADAEDFEGGGEAADHEQMAGKPTDASIVQDDKSEPAQRPSGQGTEVPKADVVSSPTSRGMNIYSGQPQEVAAHTAELIMSPSPQAFEMDNMKDKFRDIPSLAAPFKEKVLEDNVESPILGRDTGTEAAEGMSMNKNQEESLGWGAKTSKTNTMVSDMDEAVDRGFEAETRRDLPGGRPLKSPERGFEVGGFRSPVPTILPPVQEEAHEGAETEHRLLYRPASRTTLGSPDPTRDSGFTTGSPHPFKRSGFDEEERDSGVQLREWQGQRSPGRDEQRTPELKSHRSERRRSRELERAKSPTDRAALLRSPAAEGETHDHPLSKTPVLREPTGRELTPEPQKYRRTVSPELERKRSKYQDLASAALAGAAISSTCSSPRSTPPPGNRSVSDRVARLQSPAPTDSVARRSMSNSSLSRHRRAMGTPTPEPLKFRPESPGIQRSGTATPPLRRVDRRVSGDLRSLSQRSHLDLTKDPKEPTSNTPVANEGRVRTKDMADVFDGFGEGRIGSPRSPTRPHSMRRRQSMQVLELESRVEQLMAENQMLADARAHAESHNSNRASGILAERDAEIDVLKQSLEFLQKEVARLAEVNEGLNSANAQLAAQHNERYRSLETQHADTSRRLEEARAEQGHFQESLLQKDAEIGRLRSELEAAKDKIRQMQRQILATKGADSDFLNVQDVDHFDHRCQQLCSHVQQWVLRFSKFSDMRSCRLTSEINDEKVIDRLDNAILDGTDVDTYLADRVKRRDVFMSMTMNMIWEFVFTRYLFGMDREQRQKLKSLEKLLTEVGPPRAVRQWRAVTLTLLSKRPSFKHQRDLDTEAVVQAIFQTLSKVLPPPSNLEDQIQSQLRRVMREAVDLSIEMRTQRAEYMMLPPLQPEYDADGELADTVTFNAALMNERSADKSVTNEVLEAQKAVVRIVLFPLVVKKGDDGGNNDDEIVVCPAQVLVARPKGSKAVRLFTPGSDTGGASISGQTAAMHSDISMGTFLPDQASTQS
ncbi:hypothetical protein CGRA01v4_05049 [Colletotrichum graminicola]|nr:hypothetical protein CGRA01v4_05049 [Colletotrichum graminicola]